MSGGRLLLDPELLDYGVLVCLSIWLESVLKERENWLEFLLFPNFQVQPKGPLAIKLWPKTVSEFRPLAHSHFHRRGGALQMQGTGRRLWVPCQRFTWWTTNWRGPHHQGGMLPHYPCFVCLVNGWSLDHWLLKKIQNFEKNWQNWKKKKFANLKFCSRGWKKFKVLKKFLIFKKFRV